MVFGRTCVRYDARTEGNVRRGRARVTVRIRDVQQFAVLRTHDVADLAGVDGLGQPTDEHEGGQDERRQQAAGRIRKVPVHHELRSTQELGFDSAEVRLSSSERVGGRLSRAARCPTRDRFTK